MADKDQRPAAPPNHTVVGPGDDRFNLVAELGREVSNVLARSRVDVSDAIAALWTAIALGYAHQVPRECDPLGSYDAMAKFYRDRIEARLKEGAN